MMFNEICKEHFRDVLSMDKFMIACHDPNNTIRLTTPSSFKACRGMENSTNYHADEADISTIDNGLDIARRTNDILDKDNTTPRIIHMTDSQLNNNRIMKHRSTHNRKFIVRQER